MKRIDVVILRELIGPWCFGVAMFTVVIFASTYLFQLSQLLVNGATPWKVAEMTLLYLPGIVAKTFAMALLLAGLLGFGRLSSDSEVVAMRAAGVPILRMMVPVAGFSLAIAILSFGLNESVVPPATMRALSLQTEIAKELNSLGDQQLAATQTDSKGNKTKIDALDFNIASRSMVGVTITSYDKDGKPSYILLSPLMTYVDQNNWEIVGGGRLIAYDGSFVADLDGRIWPDQIPKLGLTPEDLLTQKLWKTPDVYPIAEIRRQIERAKTDPYVSRNKIANLEYGFWNKFALPLAALVYGLLGAPLGIRNVRTGTATGFAVSIAIIFGYITLANLMNVYAMGGAIPAYLASFTPLVIGLIAAGVIIWRRNG